MSKTALILVDVINAFFDPAGPHYYPRVREAVEPLTHLLATARDAGAVVVQTVERHRPNVPDAEQPKIPVHCLAGSFEADFHPGFHPVDRPGELVVPKRRYSGFFATDLALTLHEQRIERIVVAGVETNVCVRATCQDGFAHGFAVVVPREATNSDRQHLERASLEDIMRYFGSVVATDEAAALLKEHP